MTKMHKITLLNAEGLAKHKTKKRNLKFKALFMQAEPCFTKMNVPHYDCVFLQDEVHCGVSHVVHGCPDG